MALAYISGNLKMLKKRSLLTGQENYVTIEIKTKESFRGVYYVWSLLKKIFPERLVDGIKGMRLEASMSGAVFDLTEDAWERMNEIYNREREHKSSINFEVQLAKELPDLLEQDQPSGGGGYRDGSRDRNGWGNGGYNRGGGDRWSGRDSGYGGGAGGGYGGSSYGYGGSSHGGGSGSYGGGSGSHGGGVNFNAGPVTYGQLTSGGGGGGVWNRNEASSAPSNGFNRPTPTRPGGGSSVFVGGLSFSTEERDLEDFLNEQNVRFSRVKVVKGNGVLFSKFA